MSQYVNKSASALAYAFPCQLQGVFVSSATGATMAIFDSSLSTSFTPAAISSFAPNTSICWYPMGGIQLLSGCNVSIAGTISYTVVID